MEDELTYVKVEKLLLSNNEELKTKIVNKYPLFCITIALRRKLYDIYNLVKSITEEDANQILILGSRYNSFETIQLGIKFGGDITINNYNILYKAIDDGNLKIVELLQKHDIDIHHDNEKALIKSCQLGKAEICEFLVNNGANIHILDDYPLREAVRINNLDIVKILVEHGADISVYNYVAFIDACSRGFNKIVEYLINSGKIENINMMTGYPLYIALFNNRIETAEILLEYGADPNIGNTYLMDYIVKEGNIAEARLLIKYGANYKKGDNILYKIAENNNDKEMMILLSS